MLQSLNLRFRLLLSATDSLTLLQCFLQLQVACCSLEIASTSFFPLLITSSIYQFASVVSSVFECFRQLPWASNSSPQSATNGNRLRYIASVKFLQLQAHFGLPRLLLPLFWSLITPGSFQSASNCFSQLQMAIVEIVLHCFIVSFSSSTPSSDQN